MKHSGRNSAASLRVTQIGELPKPQPPVGVWLYACFGLFWRDA
jgi:uncharacterized protein YqjF (DUF2071 family)